MKPKREPGWVERILLKCFKHKDIRKEIDGQWSLYLRRFYILKVFGYAVFLHIIFRSDEDRFLHDHPWNFWSLILKNGYDEELFVTPGFTDSPTYRRPIRVGNLVRHKAEDAHRLHLLDGQPTWSLFIHGQRRRIWGFHTDSGWLPFTTYFQAGSETDGRTKQVKPLHV